MDYAYYALCFCEAVLYFHDREMVVGMFSIHSAVFDAELDQRTGSPIDKFDGLYEDDSDLESQDIFLRRVQPKITCDTLSFYGGNYNGDVEHSQYLRFLAPPELQQLMTTWNSKSSIAAAAAVATKTIITKNPQKCDKGSDVWYLGLLIWHIFDEGFNPFDPSGRVEISTAQDLIRFQTGVPCKPKYFQGDFEILKRCWSHDKRERISVTELRDYFKDLYLKLSITSSTIQNQKIDADLKTKFVPNLNKRQQIQTKKSELIYCDIPNINSSSPSVIDLHSSTTNYSHSVGSRFNVFVNKETV